MWPKRRSDGSIASEVERKKEVKYKEENGRRFRMGYISVFHFPVLWLCFDLRCLTDKSRLKRLISKRLISWIEESQRLRSSSLYLQPWWFKRAFITAPQLRRNSPT